MQVRPPAVAAALLPVGACLAMDPAGWSPFGPAKWLAVSVLTLLVVALAFRAERLRIARAPTIAWTALVVLMAVAAIGGLDPLYVWTGTPERHLGVFGWLLIGATFVAGQQLRRSDRVVIAAGLVAAGCVIGVYATVEAVWRGPIRLDTISDRLGGPFGSPAFLGAACALLLPPLAGATLDRSLPRWLRRAAAPAAVGCVVALVGSAARAAWLSVTIAAAVAIVARWIARRRDSEHDPEGDVVVTRHRDRRLFGAVAIGLVVLCVVVLGGQIGSGLERTHGASSRVDEWRIALRVIGDRPVLGTGPEGYRLAVPGNVDAAYERDYGRQVMPDRAHSGFFDVTATGGIAAGLTYAALLSMTAVALWRALRPGDPLLVGVATGVGAYLLQQQLLFPLAELDPVAWLLAGAVLAWTPANAAAGADGGGRRPAPRWQLAVGAVAGLVAVVSLVAGVLDVAADRFSKRALNATAAGDADRAVDLADRAVDLRPDVLRYRLVLGRAEQATGTLSGTDRWLAAVDDALDVSPLDPIVRQERGLALNHRAAITGTDSDTTAALSYWQELVTDDRHNARWQLELGRAAAAAGDVAAARQAWTAAADLDPDDPTPTALLAALPPE